MYAIRSYYAKKSLPKNPASSHLRITPLGGNEEVGRNMTVFEYDGDVIILDMGIQFPEERNNFV